MKEPYSIYLEKYGKVQSGNKLDRSDYCEMSGGAFAEYDDERRLAVSLAAQDVKMKVPLRSKSEFEEEIKRLGG